MLEFIKFIADILLFIGDVLGLAVSVVYAIMEFLHSFLAFITNAIKEFAPYTNLVPFLAFGLSNFVLYVVKAIFGR